MVRWKHQAGVLGLMLGISAMGLAGCGGNTIDNVAGLAGKTMNVTVGQPMPPSAADVRPVQLVQFDHRSKTVSIVVTTLPVDERSSTVGQTRDRDFSEYRDAPLSISIPVGSDRACHGTGQGTVAIGS